MNNARQETERSASIGGKALALLRAAALTIGVISVVVIDALAHRVPYFTNHSTYFFGYDASYGEIYLQGLNGDLIIIPPMEPSHYPPMNPGLTLIILVSMLLWIFIGLFWLWQFYLPMIDVSRLPSHRLGPSPRRPRPRPMGAGPRRKVARVVRRGAAYG